MANANGEVIVNARIPRDVIDAARDLQQRGPGDFFGTRQSGLPTLRVGDLLRDHAIMEDARREAVAALDDPQEAEALIAFVRSTWEKRFGLGEVG